MAWDAKYTLERANRLISEGLCSQCGIRPLVTKRMCRECQDISNDLQNIRNQALRREVLNVYGAPHCACCGLKFEFEFLHLDHKHGGGNAHRRSLSKTKTKTSVGYQVYIEAKRNGFPEGYQALCANCNMAKGLYGICPHERDREIKYKESAGLLSLVC